MNRKRQRRDQDIYESSWWMREMGGVPMWALVAISIALVVFGVFVAVHFAALTI